MNFLSYRSPLESFKFRKEPYVNLIDRDSSTNKEFFNCSIESYSNWVDFDDEQRILSVIATSETVLTYSISFDRHLDTLDEERVNDDIDHTFIFLMSKGRNIRKIGNSIIDVDNLCQMIFTDHSCSSLAWWNPDLYSKNDFSLAVEGIERNENIVPFVCPALTQE